jgi:hypothetical protein
MEPADMMASVSNSLKERTGRSLDGWVTLVQSEGPDPLDQKAVRAWLKDDTETQGRGTYIPVVRKTQFVAVAPGPRGTLRVGLRYRGEAPDDERISPAKGFAQSTHWLHLPPDAKPDDIESLAPLIAAAYGDTG